MQHGARVFDELGAALLESGGEERSGRLPSAIDLLRANSSFRELATLAAEGRPAQLGGEGQQQEQEQQQQQHHHQKSEYQQPQPMSQTASPPGSPGSPSLAGSRLARRWLAGIAAREALGEEWSSIMSTKALAIPSTPEPRQSRSSTLTDGASPTTPITLWGDEASPNPTL
jgi:hypothetical protein